MVASATSPEGRRPRQPQIFKSDLSPACARLLEMIQDLRYGRIERLPVINGEPVFEPGFQVVHTIKLGGEAGSRTRRPVGDFALRSEAVNLFGFLTALGDGVIDRLEVRDGLPVYLEMRTMAI